DCEHAYPVRGVAGAYFESGSGAPRVEKLQLDRAAGRIHMPSGVELIRQGPGGTDALLLLRHADEDLALSGYERGDVPSGSSFTGGRKPSVDGRAGRASFGF